MALGSKKPPSIWTTLWQEAARACEQEPALAPLIEKTVTTSRNLGEAISRILVDRLAQPDVTEEILTPILENFTSAQGTALHDTIARDLEAIMKNDPAAKDVLTPFLFFKGFHALQAYRLSHYLWNARRHHLACFVQARAASRFGVDIHPAAKIGSGVMMDHATGIVIGETAVVEDDVLFWHGVTLGGTGATSGDRHPKIRQGAVLGAQSTLLGNIEIGAGAKIGAGSVVVGNIPPGVTAVGVPAKIIS